MAGARLHAQDVHYSDLTWGRAIYELPQLKRKNRQFVRFQRVWINLRRHPSGIGTAFHVSRMLAFEKFPLAALEAIVRRPDRMGGHAAENCVLGEQKKLGRSEKIWNRSPQDGRALGRDQRRIGHPA